MSGFAFPLGGPFGGDPLQIDFLSPTPDTAPGAPGGFSATYAIAQNTPIVLEVLMTSIVYLTVSAAFLDGSIETVYMGGSFVGKYINGSAQAALTPGLQLTFARQGGWPGATAGQARTIAILVTAVDNTGSTLSGVGYFDMPQATTGVVIPVQQTNAGAVDLVAEALSKIVWQFRSA